MKQTAVQWLEECINIGLTYEQQVMFEGLFQQAKAMEIEQTKIHSIDEELFKHLPIEAVNYASCSVTHAHYFTTKMHLDKFKANYKMQCIDINCDGINRKGNCIESNKPKLDEYGNLIKRTQ